MYPLNGNNFPMTFQWPKVKIQGPFTCFIAWKRHVPRQEGRMWQTISCMIWSPFKQNHDEKINLFLFACWTYQYFCNDVQEPTPHGFARGWLLISITFLNFPKPGVKFHIFSRPGKRKCNSMTFPGFAWLDTPCFYCQFKVSMKTNQLNIKE